MKAVSRLRCALGIHVILTCVSVLFFAGITRSSAAPALDAEYRQSIEKDWARQELRFGRTSSQPEALAAALLRAEKLCPPAQVTKFKEESKRASEMSAVQREALYNEVRWAIRDEALRNPLLQGKPILFMKRHRFICQMLHEYMAYFYDYGNVSGGGLYVLEKPGASFATRDLVQGRLPKGNFITLALAPDGGKAYFGYAERAPKKPDYRSPERRGFHINEINLTSGSIKQLTSGCEDDFDPCPLPDGSVAFMSTRRGGFARCNNAWEPTASYTLHRMDADGGNIRMLSCHETAEWHPSLLNDGRIAYIRWDYVDRSAANFHGIWACNPDGSGVTSLFGNYTMKINACYQPKAIPGSQKILFVAGAHHADVGGSLVMLDPSRARLDAKSGEDKFDSIERLSPEICFPESDGWPKSYFHSPNPLSEECMLVSFSFDPLPGMSSGENRDTPTGLYYFDRSGNLELLYRDPEISSMYPLLLSPSKTKPRLPETAATPEETEGEFVLGNVKRSLMPFPEGREVTELRIFQILPKVGAHAANEPRIGHANAENARMLIGSVPVEKDGSAYFKAPARKPLYFQAVDSEGRAVQGMRSVAYVQPGERRSCVGCHEPVGAAVETRPLMATKRTPSRIKPGPEGTYPFSYVKLVQPVLDRGCVSCHDGSSNPGKFAPNLTSQTAGTFTKSYQQLKKFVRWYEWGGASISQIATEPGRQGADESPISKTLSDANHRSITLSDADRRILYLWLDFNVPFYGTYDKDEQIAQMRGQNIKASQAQ